MDYGSLLGHPDVISSQYIHSLNSKFQVPRFSKVAAIKNETKPSQQAETMVEKTKEDDRGIAFGAAAAYDEEYLGPTGEGDYVTELQDPEEADEELDEGRVSSHPSTSRRMVSPKLFNSISLMKCFSHTHHFHREILKMTIHLPIRRLVRAWSIRTLTSESPSTRSVDTIAFSEKMECPFKTP
jgi:hypothetical protein